MKGRGFSALFWPLIALLVFGALLWAERTGVPYSLPVEKEGFLPESELRLGQKAPGKECLLIYDSGPGVDLHTNIEFVLKSMSVGFDSMDVQHGGAIDPANYRTVVLAMMDLEVIQQSVLPLLDWVEEGGQLLMAYSPDPSTTLSTIARKLGIENADIDFHEQKRARLKTQLMPGGQDLELDWGEGRSGLAVRLAADCTVHMVSVDEAAGELPMLWERKLGRGKIVVSNNDAFAFRESRGLVAAAYSLLGDAFAYPVINASMFFLDDFPAPVPSGHNEYIDRFYQMDVDSFYTNVWFPAIQNYAKQYGLKYTGMLIELYSDAVKQPFEEATDLERYRYFGNISLQDGAEIGLHGYNHMPLVLPGFDYQGLFEGYKPWSSEEDIVASIKEAIRFCGEAFPGTQMKTYVPPSNILNDEGRRILRENFPQINTIASVYLPDDLCYVQEFGVGEDGIIDLPRVIAGCLLSDYDRWVALNELSFHYVNSHFMHPDDALDPDRGAEQGGEWMSANLDGYLKWLYGSAKGIRNLTAQQGAMAVQRYSNLTVSRTEVQGNYILDLDGHYDEAWLLVRLNGGEPGEVQGGTLQPVGGGLYLLRATQDRVVIDVKGGE